jgi:lipopolysaccharide biosynthesis glycosyltransferase
VSDGGGAAPLELGCAVEGSFIPHSAAMLHSALSHLGGLSARVHYLHPPGFPSSAKGQLTRMVEGLGASVQFVEVPDVLCSGLPTQGFTGKATWYRIFIPDLLPAVDRLLFLDADTVVLDGLRPLWETDLRTNYVGAVSNVFQPDHLYRPAELGFDRPQEYFNAGVLLMDLGSLRHDGCVASMVAYGRRFAENLTFRDQDVLNVVLQGRRLPLHPRWNCMNSVMHFPWSSYVFGVTATEEARASPAIRHFEGPTINKPWHLLSEAPLRHRYFEHRRQTPWPRVRRTGVTPANVARKIARARRR